MTGLNIISMLHARNDYSHIQDPTGRIPAGEPVFLLRGSDVLAPATLLHWCSLANAAGVKSDMVNSAIEHQEKMVEWQRANGSKVPDMPEGAMEAMSIEQLSQEAERSILRPEIKNVEKDFVSVEPGHLILMGVMAGLKNGNNYAAVTMQCDGDIIWLQEDRGAKGIFCSDTSVRRNLYELSATDMTEIVILALRDRKNWKRKDQLEAPKNAPVPQVPVEEPKVYSSEEEARIAAEEKNKEKDPENTKE